MIKKSKNDENNVEKESDNCQNRDSDFKEKSFRAYLVFLIHDKVYKRVDDHITPCEHVGEHVKVPIPVTLVKELKNFKCYYQLSNFSTLQE